MQEKDIPSSPVSPSLQHQRLAKGLCPSCGEPAAPYYLCDRCRAIALIRRVINRGVQAGTFQSRIDEQDRRRKLYAMKNGDIAFDYREALEGDKRLAPRLNKIPIDVEAEVRRLLREADHPLTDDELYEAWGTLRLRPERLSTARDLVTIIQAQRKRKRRAQR
jgi:hypothetical protein